MRWIFLDGCTVSGPTGTTRLPSGGLSALAAVLVLNHDRPVQRDRIAEILWDGDTPDTARDRINTMIWRLRKLLKAVGGRVESFDNQREFLIYCAPVNFAVDTEDVSSLSRDLMRGGMMTESQARACLACVESCNTDFLPAQHDHWSIVTRESLRSGLLMMIEALMIYMRDQERWGRVSELADRLLALDPTLESGHQQMIDLHGARDDVGSAQRHFDVMQKVLRDRLDVAPAPETAAALDALRINRARQTLSMRETLVKRPGFKAVQSALHHIDAARDKLLGQ